MRLIKRSLKSIKRIRLASRKILSINKRNLLYIYKYNSRKDYHLADNKLITKNSLAKHHIPTPETYKSYSHFYELSSISDDLGQLDSFVIKPACGKAGGGIIVIIGKKGGRFIGINGKDYSVDDIKHHIGEIIFGVYSFDMQDTAVIEERIIQHDVINTMSPYGLSDIRLILCENKPVMAMVRLPTNESGGRANLHQGAVGVGIDIVDGVTKHGVYNDKSTTCHPDTGNQLIGVTIPYWEEIIQIGIKAATILPLKYLGADIAVTNKGPIIIELNVRPGLAIQNCNNESLLIELLSHN